MNDGRSPLTTIAFDDIKIDQCGSFITVTTSNTTTIAPASTLNMIMSNNSHQLF